MKIARSEWNGGMKDVFDRVSPVNIIWWKKESVLQVYLTLDVADCQWLHQHSGDVSITLF